MLTNSVDPEFSSGSALFAKNNLHGQKYNVELTPDRPQSKKKFTIDECRSKIDRNSVFDCHLSPVRRQKAIKNSVSIDFFIYIHQ